MINSGPENKGVVQKFINKYSIRAVIILGYNF